MRNKSVYFIEVGGTDITNKFQDEATDITVTDASGKSSDSASISISDDNGQIKLPPIGEYIRIGIGWDVPIILFEGTIDEPDSGGDRGGGRTLTFSAKSADTVKGKAKEQSQKHKDDSTFGDVAAEWGKASGLDEVLVHSDLASITRDYWSMNGESFIAWGERIADQFGAMFKVVGTRGLFIPRNSGLSASGKLLTPVTAQYGVNLISWRIKPTLGRPQHKSFRTRFYDLDEAEWKDQEEDSEYDTDAEAVQTSRYSEPDESSSKHKSKSKSRKSARDKGGGSIDIDGDPTAQAEAPIQLIGARDGVDGTYRIDSVTHKRSRGGGFTTSCSVKQPSGKAGKDTRGDAPDDSDDDTDIDTSPDDASLGTSDGNSATV